MVAVLIGLFSGVISGMGIGGGAILIPALSFFLQVNQHDAQGINLLYFLPTAAVSLYVHIRNRNVKYKAVMPIILWGLVGAVGGAFVAGLIKTEVLRRCFGVFLLCMGVYEFFKKEKKQKIE
ncbi:MAG: sulfite exporter TauE/SafE family protein [Ruminococcaceae bacterium]|nr:sulfite exporter TauE/SafE family protein [Oscillospiraceae bacterium]